MEVGWGVGGWEEKKGPPGVDDVNCEQCKPSQPTTPTHPEILALTVHLEL